MRMSVVLTVVAAAAGLIVVLAVGLALVIDPSRPLILAAEFSHEAISPNADGDDDVALFSYSLSRNARVTISFEGEDGSTFVFRNDEPRPADDYQVLFSGVVDGFTLAGETIAGEVERRLMPNGSYTWRLAAVDVESGEAAEASGSLTLSAGDAPLPELVDFTVSPEQFTPNQDGIRDRAEISVFLTKDADLRVFLEGESGARIFISERQEGRKPGEAGRHQFDYDGGVDLGADPPEDGVYTVIAEAQDAVGQRVRRATTLTLEAGGKPLAEIVPQAVGASVVFDVEQYEGRFFSDLDVQGDLVEPPDDPAALDLRSVTMPVGNLLIFKLTVENYSDVPIRTTGPPPGTVYDQEQRAAGLGWIDESGAWRVGIDCTTAASDYPWRWAVGDEDSLVTVVDDETGHVFRYLPPGRQAVVWGAVRMQTISEARNPQDCWAGLIHEDVEVSLRNNRVGARQIELVEVDDE